MQPVDGCPCTPPAKCRGQLAPNATWHDQFTYCSRQVSTTALGFFSTAVEKMIGT